MKKKQQNNIIKNGGVIAALAIILCSAVILFGCKDLFVPPEPGYITEETGFFILSITGSNNQSRTIMPDIDREEEWSFYKLVITPTAEGFPMYIPHEELDKVFELPPATYQLMVYAYTDEADAYKTSDDNPNGEYVARTSSAFELVITAGSMTAKTITLTAVSPTAKGSGNFSWNIEYPAGVLDVIMVVTPISSTPGTERTYRFPGVTATGAEIEAAKDGGDSLPSGFYRVVFTLTKDNFQQVNWRETLHVYRNLESHYEYNFTDNHFIADIYTVNLIYDKAFIADSVFSVFHGRAITEPADPSNDDWHFEGWYEESGYSNKWDFVTTITGPKTLYANWIEKLKGKVTLTLVVEETTSTIVITYDEDFNVAEADRAALTYKWFFNNAEQAATGAVYTVPQAQAGGNFRVEIRHPGFYGHIEGDLEGEPLLGETADNPLLVNSLAALNRIGTDVFSAGGYWTKDAYYRQTGLITVGSGAWTPISQRIPLTVVKNLTEFVGNYDGNGWEIRDITWTSNTGADNLSIFGTIGVGGVVENLIAINPRITARDKLGVIASVNRGTIRKSVVHNININGRDNVGGLAGDNLGTIIDCYTTGVVFGHGAETTDEFGVRIGGITGFNTGTVQRCYSTATITGDNFVGGIVGQNDSGTVSYSVALNPNITSRRVNAGRVSAGTGTFTENQTRNETATFANSIRATEATVQNPRVGHDGTGRRTNNSVGLAGTIFTVANGWTTGDTGNWIVPSGNLNENGILPSLRILRTPQPTPPAAPVLGPTPVPTLPPVRNRTTENTATFNIDINNFIAFNQDGDEGYWVKEVAGNWVLGEMLEGRPSGPVTVPANIINTINGRAAHNYANDNNTEANTTYRYDIGDAGTLRIWGSNDNKGRMNFSFQLNFPVIGAEIVFRVYDGSVNPNNIFNPTRQNYYCTRDQVTKVGWFHSLTSATEIRGALYGPNVAAQNNNITQFDTGGFNMQIDIYVQTYENWTYVPDNNVNVSEPYVIFEIEGSEDYYWFDEGRGHGQSSGMGATDLFTSIVEPSTPEGDWIFSFEPPKIEDFVITGNISQPIPSTDIPLYIRTEMPENISNPPPGVVFRKKNGGPDRNARGLDYSFPLTEARTNRDRAVRINPNIVLNTGEIVGRAEIILVRATTTSNPAGTNYILGNTASNPVEIDIVLHLNEDFRHDLRAINPILLQGISNTNITTLNFPVNTNATNFTMVVPFDSSNNTYLVKLRNTINSGEIARFNRVTGSPPTGGMVFQFNYQ